MQIINYGTYGDHNNYMYLWCESGTIYILLVLYPVIINTEASICFIFSFSYKVNSVRFQVQIICIHSCRVASVQQHAGSSDPIAVMGFLREEKNTFKPKM